MKASDLPATLGTELKRRIHLSLRSIPERDIWGEGRRGAERVEAVRGKEIAHAQQRLKDLHSR